MKITKQQSEDMLEAAKPLMEWLNSNCHLNTHINVSNTTVTLNEVVCHELVPLEKSAGRIICSYREDEMISLAQGGKNAGTLYATCPEQAEDFITKYNTLSMPTFNDWQSLLYRYKLYWKSKHPDED